MTAPLKRTVTAAEVVPGCASDSAVSRAGTVTERSSVHAVLPAASTLTTRKYSTVPAANEASAMPTDTVPAPCCALWLAYSPGRSCCAVS